MPWIYVGMLGALAVGYCGPDLLLAIPDLVAAKTTASNPSSLVGRASVIDGDTVEIHGERIRFNGIDAPEAAQTCKDGNGATYRCGARAAEAVDQFLKASSPVRCDFVERDQYGRFVGNCFRADGTSVQSALVRKGWAMDWPRHSGGAYANEQAAARSERIGTLQSIPGVCGRRSLGLIRSEVDDLLRTTMEKVPVVPASGTHGLTTAASLMGVEAGLLATFVVAGQIKPVGRGEGPLAFRNLRFTPSGNLPPNIIGTRKRKPRDRKKEHGSRRLAAVELMEQVGMDEACSRLGLRRETLELWGAVFAEGGFQGLYDLKYEARHPQTTPKSVAARVRALGRKDVRNSCKRIAAILREEGTPISSRTAWKILKGAGLGTAKDRQKAIEGNVRRPRAPNHTDSP